MQDGGARGGERKNEWEEGGEGPAMRIVVRQYKIRLYLRRKGSMFVAIEF